MLVPGSVLEMCYPKQTTWLQHSAASFLLGIPINDDSCALRVRYGAECIYIYIIERSGACTGLLHHRSDTMKSFGR